MSTDNKGCFNTELSYDINLTTLEEFNKVVSPGFPFFAENTRRCFFANDSYPWHWHPTVQFFYVTEGCMQYSVPGHTYTFCQGDGAFLNAHVLHKLQYPDEKPCSFPCILFHPTLVGGDSGNDIMKKYVRPLTDHTDFDIFLLHHTIPAHRQILDLVKECYELYEKKEPYYELLIRSRLSLLWIQFSEVTRDYRQQLKGKMSSTRLKTILTYLNDHYMEKISLADLAKAGMCSGRECNRIFQDQLHTTPFQYLLALRLQKACSCLIDTDLSVTEIGAACGFSDTSYFGKLFRQHYGLSPREYRNQKYLLLTEHLPEHTKKEGTHSSY